jgi:cell division protein FtsW (lipid II flippase)
MDNTPKEDAYQIEKAKIAIASGGIYGLGPGKSVQKTFYLNHRPILFLPLLLKNMGWLELSESCFYTCCSL